MRHRERSDGRRDGGETLVEVLVSIVLLGLAAVSIVAGLTLTVKASDIHRKETTGGAYVRNYAEAIQRWVTTHPAQFKCSPDYSASTVGFTVPSGFKVSALSVTSVGPTGATVACTQDASQMVKVTIASNDGRASERLAFVLRRPCATNVASGGDPCS